MKNEHTKSIRQLAIVPSSRGFSYALLEGSNRLMDWGQKTATGDINKHCIPILKKMISHFLPTLLVIEDATDPKGRRGLRVKKLLGEFAKLAATEKLQLQAVLREEVSKALLGLPEGTKHEVANTIAEKFSEELGALLPSKRELWESEDYYMGTFEAVGLALAAYHLRESKRLGNE